MADVKGQVMACGVKAATGVKVSVRVKVTTDGHVANASVAGAPDPMLRDCIGAAMRNAVFARTRLGGTFAYPFVF